MSPKVSVIVVTYNHAHLIDEALDSVFSQKTDFKFEVIISEDASTDGTQEIVRRWYEKYPSVVRLLLSSENLRSNETVRRGFHAARGDYVALLDGDDAWTSPYKLAKQAAVLDNDPSVSLCIHNAEVFDGTTRQEELWTNPHLKRRLGLADLWEGNPFATCGSFFRRSSLPQIPDWYCKVQDMITDWPLYLLFAEKGDIIFLPEALGIYRLHNGGLYSSLSISKKIDATDRLYRTVNEGMRFRHDRSLRQGRQRYFLGMAKDYLRKGDLPLARACIDRARTYSPPHALRGIAEVLWLELRSRLSQRLVR